jgi:outer membrane protein assembly factor BamB
MLLASQKRYRIHMLMKQTVFGRHLAGRFGFQPSLLLLLLLISIVGIPVYSFSDVNPTRRVDLSQPLTVQWRFASEQTINLTPATDGERVYLPLANGALVSLATQNGQLVWKTEIGGELSAAPLADERGVYVSSETVSDGKSTGPRAMGALRALGRESGVTLWMRTMALPLRAALAMNQDTIFGGASDGQIYAIRKQNGDILWSKQFPAPFASRLTLVGSRLYIGAEDGQLFSLDQQSGKTFWRYQTRGAIRGPVAVADGVVFFGSADGYVYAVGETDGRLRWRSRTGAGVQSVLSVQNGLLVASLDNFVYFLSLTRGDRVWKRQLGGRLAAEPLATFDGALFTPLSSDNGVVLNFKDGKQINSVLLGEDSNTAASPIIAGDMLLVTTRNGLLAFSNPSKTTQKK